MGLKEKLFEEKVSSMKQLDRIELRLIANKNRQVINSHIVLVSTCFVISMMLLCTGTMTFLSLYNLFIYNLYYTNHLIGFTISIIGSLLYVFVGIKITTDLNKFIKGSVTEMDNFIEEHTK